MKANVGGIDKVLRILVGALLLALVFMLESPLNWWGLVGVVPLFTGLLGYCPLYSLLGFSSCPMERRAL
jgi:hypothetical protein